MVLKCLTLLYSFILKSLVRLGIKASVFIRQRVLKTEIVLVACMPKSGSTYVSNKIANLKNWKRVGFVPSYGHREQELCAFTTLYKSLVYINRNIVAQHHVRLSHETAKVINQFGIKVITLTRDIEDCLSSTVDHAKNESCLGPSGFWNQELMDAATASGVSNFEALARTNVAWYVNFYVSWSQHESFDIQTDMVGLKYEEFFEDPAKNLRTALEAINLTYSCSEIQDAVEATSKDRKNKGVRGRGHETLAKNAPLKEYIDSLYRCYPGLDFRAKIEI